MLPLGRDCLVLPFLRCCDALYGSCLLTTVKVAISVNALR